MLGTKKSVPRGIDFLVFFRFEWKGNSHILDFEGLILGFVKAVLHLDGPILELTRPIQGFEHHILKFMILKQFNSPLNDVS